MLCGDYSWQLASQEACPVISEDCNAKEFSFIYLFIMLIASDLSYDVIEDTNHRNKHFNHSSSAK